MPKFATGAIRATTMIAASIAALTIAASVADAASERVRNACANDYLAHCSQHPEEGAAVRRCMNSNGHKLSKGCVDALIADGEVSKAEVERRRQSSR